MCGEKQASRYLPATLLGSPPRVRGKAGYLAIKRMDEGITPAYAGKREPRNPEGRQQRDHPRVCGEKPAAPADGYPGLGSPPRMRGKVTLLYALADKERITPAYAGKRRQSPDYVAIARDHPRVCGEKAVH